MARKTDPKDHLARTVVLQFPDDADIKPLNLKRRLVGRGRSGDRKPAPASMVYSNRKDESGVIWALIPPNHYTEGNVSNITKWCLIKLDRHRKASFNGTIPAEPIEDAEHLSKGQPKDGAEVRIDSKRVRILVYRDH